MATNTRSPTYAPRTVSDPWVAVLARFQQDNFLPLIVAGGGVPLNQYDWPNPRGYKPLHQDFVWQNPGVLELLSQDNIGSTPRQLDWPNPRGYAPTANRDTWTVNLLEGTLGPAPATIQFRAPTFFRNWSIDPGVALRSGGGINFTPQLTVTLNVLPFNQSDWQLSVPRADWLNAQTLLAANLVLPSIPGTPAATYDWPNPRGYVSFDLRGYTQAPTRALIDTVVGTPFAQTDWPLPPKAPTGAIDLRTWIRPSQTQLIGQDTLPPRQQDWPTPLPIPAVVASRTHYQDLLQSTLKPPVVPPPPGQYDWPNPYRPQWSGFYAKHEAFALQPPTSVPVTIQLPQVIWRWAGETQIWSKVGTTGTTWLATSPKNNIWTAVENAPSTWTKQ